MKTSHRRQLGVIVTSCAAKDIKHLISLIIHSVMPEFYVIFNSISGSLKFTSFSIVFQSCRI